MAKAQSLSLRDLIDAQRQLAAAGNKQAEAQVARLEALDKAEKATVQTTATGNTTNVNAEQVKQLTQQTDELKRVNDEGLEELKKDVHKGLIEKTGDGLNSNVIKMSKDIRAALVGNGARPGAPIPVPASDDKLRESKADDKAKTEAAANQQKVREESAGKYQPGSKGYSELIKDFKSIFTLKGAFDVENASGPLGEMLKKKVAKQDFIKNEMEVNPQDREDKQYQNAEGKYDPKLHKAALGERFENINAVRGEQKQNQDKIANLQQQGYGEKDIERAGYREIERALDVKMSSVNPRYAEQLKAKSAGVEAAAANTSNVNGNTFNTSTSNTEQSTSTSANNTTSLANSVNSSSVIPAADNSNNLLLANTSDQRNSTSNVSNANATYDNVSDSRVGSAINVTPNNASTSYNYNNTLAGGTVNTNNTRAAIVSPASIVQSNTLSNNANTASSTNTTGDTTSNFTGVPSFNSNLSANTTNNASKANYLAANDILSVTNSNAPLSTLSNNRLVNTSRDVFNTNQEASNNTSSTFQDSTSNVGSSVSSNTNNQVTPANITSTNLANSVNSSSVIPAVGNSNNLLLASNTTTNTPANTTSSVTNNRAESPINVAPNSSTSSAASNYNNTTSNALTGIANTNNTRVNNTSQANVVQSSTLGNSTSKFTGDTSFNNTSESITANSVSPSNYLTAGNLTATTNSAPFSALTNNTVSNATNTGPAVNINPVNNDIITSALTNAPSSVTSNTNSTPIDVNNIVPASNVAGSIFNNMAGDTTQITKQAVPVKQDTVAKSNVISILAKSKKGLIGAPATAVPATATAVPATATAVPATATAVPALLAPPASATSAETAAENSRLMQEQTELLRKIEENTRSSQVRSATADDAAAQAEPQKEGGGILGDVADFAMDKLGGKNTRRAARKAKVFGGKALKFLGGKGGAIAGGVLAVGAGAYTAYEGWQTASQNEEGQKKAIDQAVASGQITKEQGEAKKVEAEQVASVGKGEAVGEGGGMAAGAIGGAALGAKAGMVIGSIIPGAGTVVGGLVGGALGGAVGGIAGSSAGKAIGGYAVKGYQGIKSFFGGEDAAKPVAGAAMATLAGGAATVESLQTQRDKLVKQGPATNSPQSKLAHENVVATLDKAIAAKKADTTTLRGGVPVSGSIDTPSKLGFAPATSASAIAPIPTSADMIASKSADNAGAATQQVSSPTVISAPSNSTNINQTTSYTTKSPTRNSESSVRQFINSRYAY